MSHPDRSVGEVECGEEIDGAAIVARNDVSEVFELVEEVLDAVAQFIGDCVMWDLDFAGALGGDDSRGFGVADLFAQRTDVSGFIRDNTGRCTASEEIGGGGAVVSPFDGQDEALGAARGVG